MSSTKAKSTGSLPSAAEIDAQSSLSGLKRDSEVFESDEELTTSSASSIYAPTLRRSDSSLSVSFIDLSKLLFVNDFDFGLNLDSVSGSTKKRFQDMKLKTKQKFSKYNKRPMRDIELNNLQEKINKQLQKFDQRLQKNLQSSSTEKLFYALAVFSIATSGFVIGKYPTYFPLYHTILLALLMPIRFYTYFKQSFQYFLADLCYYVNLLLMAFIWVFPDSTSLFVSTFALSMGTLSFAVITWRNSLVLHSIEKTTSSFIHVMPPVTMFVIVHELPEDFIKVRYPAVASIDSWNFVNGILWTSFYYTLWQVCYHYFITIRKKKEILNGRVTSFTFLKKKNSKSTLGRWVNSLPYLWMQTAAFTLIQFGYQILTMSFCPIWFKYKHLCGAFVSTIFIWASYNGATYYIDVFGKRLEKEAARLKEEVLHLQQENEKLQSKLPITASKVGHGLYQRLFSTSRIGFQESNKKVKEHVDFLSKYYSPELLQSIKITESLVDPQEILDLKKKGFRAFSKVAPTQESSDYALTDAKWEEPVVFPNQAKQSSPYPEIPQIASADRSDLKIRFKEGGPGKRVFQRDNLAGDIAKLTGLEENYIKSLYVRPIIMKRVSNKTSKGNIPSFFVMTIVGDKKGTIGLGIGKSRDGVRVAARKAHWNAIKNLTPIPRYEERTVLGDVEYKYHAVKLFIKSAPAGFGLRVNRNIFEVCQAAGIKDLRGKVYKSRNPVLVVKGFVEALTKQRSIEDLAAGRGKKIVDLRKVYYSN
ncbi:uncharacterized protein CANTADRAFT_3824 [Suhomyces tanzawaensis NRRL Y-17324]|uniref:Glycerophosphocholine acyltransferase 1 n=1 Tax=Suhomyces tanzawaensis NRRL Y-17324 TaxID=984487 RepID=A0A1E4SQG8_9ASCO|nr:uncharacterized protein CANTADRAFT_3824 [Suhomyces tanzawaensis NRRL Y-17324]ODV81751.1 hypothetical protein CANTADRAFT_3824 [Suhomyces tanzawaensis NRRL Y-17324]